MLAPVEKNWEYVCKSVFWSSNLSKSAWRQAILDGNVNILETSLEWMRPDVFIYHLGMDTYKDTWPLLRQQIKDVQLFSGVHLAKRCAYYDAWWSKLVCKNLWLYPFAGWLSLTGEEKNILAEMANALYSPEEARARLGQNGTYILDKFLQLGFVKVLEMPVAFGSAEVKSVYFPVKP